MRIDLVRGQERRSTTETDAAEIDFMNIKQPGGRYRDKAATVNTRCGGWLQSWTHKDNHFAPGIPNAPTTD